MIPPKDPYIQVRVLYDIGDVLLGDHSTSLKQNSVHSLRRTDAEKFISQVINFLNNYYMNAQPFLLPILYSHMNHIVHQGLMEEFVGWYKIEVGIQIIRCFWSLFSFEHQLSLYLKQPITVKKTNFWNHTE